MQAITKQTQTAITKGKYKANKQLILECCGITEDAYNSIVYECGITWVANHVWNSEEVITHVTAQEYYWHWFINQWNMREDEFLCDHTLYVMDGRFTKHLYNWLMARHERFVTVGKIYPSGDTWNKIVKDLWK